VLLDTHVWLWAAAGSTARLGRRTLRQLDRAAAIGDLYVSPVSVFELASLHLANRLAIGHPVETWIRESIDRGGLRLTDVSLAMTLDAGSIPATALPDPIDRLLVATARTLETSFVTRDRRIHDYARASGLHVVDASA
jgi:PIN domain nuclease of toxin-antitoxin system